MKRFFALALAAMMSCSLFVGSAGAVISPELNRGVDISKEVAGTAAADYKNIEFNFELDVSKIKFKDNRWEAFAKKEGITYDADRDVLCFSLKAGQSISLELPFGDEYTLSEVGGYDNEDYISTTINGVETRDHTFDVSKKDKRVHEVEVINNYGTTNPDDPKPGDPEPPLDPEEPGSEQPDKPGTDDPAGEKPVSPQTGYPVGVLALSIAAAASGAVAVVAGKKAKKD